MNLSYSEIVTSFSIWEFLSELTKSYTQMEIYKAGIIDSRGNFLKDPEDYKTDKEKRAGNTFNRLIVVLKRALLTSSDPVIRYAATNPMAALNSLAEEVESLGGDGNSFFNYVLPLVEDMGSAPVANSVAAGGVYGARGNTDEVVVSPKSAAKHKKRGPLRRYFELKEYLEEQTQKAETVGHLPHIGELLYTGRGGDAIKHLTATHARLTGRQVEGHNLSYKADGSVSLVFGKRKGTPFVQYKSGAAPAFSTEQEIDDYAVKNNKPYLVKPFKAALRAAAHPGIKGNRSYQADAILRGDNEHMVGNLIRYKAPNPRTQSMFAVHSEIDSDTGKKVGSNPDVSALSTDEHYFPNLSLNQAKFGIDRNTNRRIARSIKRATAIMSDKTVAKTLAEIGSHVDPTSKTGARHTFFRSFTQAAQEQRHPLTMKGFRSFARETIRKEKNKKQAARMQEHLKYAIANKGTMRQIFRAHRFINKARDMMYDTITSGNTPMSPVEGGVHEGAVSELAGVGQVKLVSPKFTIANRAQRDKFAKKPKA